ncbi:MAG: diguanylate cyclase, partial [Leptothrix sp. (in: b-proteobacteria)]
MNRPALAGWRTTALQLVGVASTYYLAARLGLLIPYVGTHVSLVWLPTGIAVAAYLRWGGLMSAAVFAAAFAVNVQIGGPFWMGLGIAGGNALGPWLTVLLLSRSGFDPALARRHDLGVYLLAVMLGMVVTASNGTLWLRAAGQLPTSIWAPAWMTWWVGDAVGALLGGIPLVALTRTTVRTTFGGRGGLVNIGLLGVVLGCGVWSFSPWAGAALLFPLLSLPLFVTAVLALRAGVLGASLSVLLLSGAMAWGTARGVGPFAGHDAHAGLLALWSYITAQACTSVLICGLAAELLSSQRQQAALFEHANEGIVLVGPDGHIGAINPAASALLGLQQAEVRGRRLTDLPHNGAALAQWLATAAAQPAAIAPDLSVTRDDGQSRQVELQTARHIDARGLWQTQLMLRDVTERKEAQARLAASEQRLRLITDNMPALIAYLDREQRFVFANRTYADWFGIRPESLLGKTFSDCFGAEFHAARRPHMDEALRTGQRQTLEAVSELGGRQRQLRSTYVPDLRSDGSVAGLYMLSLDISELKAVEAQLTLLARFDHLTGLANRMQFELTLQEALGRARRTRQFMALLYIDIDHFKSINDSRGHGAGDAVLVEFARRLKHSVRATDTVARLGGDEFVIVLEQLHHEAEAELVAQKIVAATRTPIALPDATG